ncbi:C39 family peptidase [Sphingomonas sp. M1-B02]|uniref:C39 family peptidase n=1 Tax=Sphingomonas sp. M1-B02 TaxID=3114300 RepID=UPI0022400BAB|nr:C39 family peptidase [Sphingomonas sp. S6-11]UZK67768.1 C39 family peptidase [Sphingomonas sp. S6-11]
MLAALGGCASAPLPERGSRLASGGVLDFQLPVTSLLGRRFETVVRQQYDFSCGSAALATLLRYHYGDRQTEQTVFIDMFRDGEQDQIRKLGFSLLDMKRYLAARGIAADGYRVTLDQIAKAGTPGIALIDFNGYKHFVVVKGFEGRTLLLGDPSLGLRREDAATFARQWNGVFFVINGRSAGGNFNSSPDLARAPRGRFYAQAEALDLAGLALTRPLNLPAPLPREF